MKKEEKHTNDLINETSPYLLQHAHNPVNWKAWNDENLESAKKEGKLLLISVGYSACHWCHVMEHESFEDEEVAEIMNQHYIPIKVDREERPDVDQVYMNAVQIMTGMGGWPMNVVAMPDGRPVWGGTYFRRDQWKSALQQIAHLYETQPEKLEEYAEKLEAGLHQLEVLETVAEVDIERSFLEEALDKWQRSFDHKNGGLKGAPKFMMPNNYEFLLRYAFQNSDEKLMKFCRHSLDRISQGGVFDVIEGGFSRYSVDDKWHVPHFEKMLYDNAQLVSLYSKVFKATGDSWYKEVVTKSLEFIKNELTHETGAFYSALDADSENREGENEEGAYYVWTREELQQILNEDFELFAEVYNINNYGKWEGENYVLIRTRNFEQIAEDEEISVEELQEKNNKWLEKLKKERRKRPKPGLDDKSLTSWNALMITGYCDAYQAFSKTEYLKAAIKNANFLLEHQFHGDNELFHNYKNGKSSINAYLEDYAFVIEAFLKLYETTFEEKYLHRAMELSETVEKNFRDKDSYFYNFTSNKDRALITKTKEISDNVIPASNSVMARNLFKLGKLSADTSKTEKALKMLQQVSEKIKEHPPYHSNWLNLMMNFTYPYYEVAIVGDEFKEIAKSFQNKYLPNKVLSASAAESNLPLLKDRLKEGKTLIYICQEQTCQKPTDSTEEALSQLNQV